jgi:DNA mismatch endonuclease (patch repair protein)
LGDVHDPATRSRNMSAIRAKDTSPEVRVRKLLHTAGFRFRLHKRSLPGSPDLVLAKHRAIIFVHGCFWHGHECKSFRWPKTREDFWRAKIGANTMRDQQSLRALRFEGWRVCLIWECALRGGERISDAELSSVLQRWLRSDSEFLELRGR